ncbi:MAG: hypothetical protein ABFD13_00925 [Candidatus Cryosericum sp.]|nr:hypothetical protein [bacterium]
MTLSSLHAATVGEARALLADLGCHVTGTNIMAPKAVFLVLRVRGLLPKAANILKQEMLAKGGEAAVPSGALCMEAPRVDCILMGTLAQYDLLAGTLKQQPFGLSELASQLVLFAHLSPARPLKHWLGSSGDIAVGGLVDCDIHPPGVHDQAANPVAHGWNLLEERSDFLVVTGSNTAVVQEVAQHLAESSGCPVAAWAPDKPPIDVTSAMPVIVQQGYRSRPTDGAVLALCTGERSMEFIEKLMTTEAVSERLFITAALKCTDGKTASISPVPTTLPRLDAVFMRRQDLAMLSMNTQVTTLTRLFDHGTSVFITDIPHHLRGLLTAVSHNPWNSSPTNR